MLSRDFWNVLFAIGIMVMAVTVGGCNNKKANPPNEIRMRLAQDLTILDPALIVDMDGGVVASKIFNGLLRYDEKLAIIPDLAEKYSMSEDGLIYRFELRKGVLFHDNTPFTAHDISATIKRVLRAQVRAWVFDKLVGAKEYRDGADDLQGIHIIDDHNIELILTQPFAPFVGFLAMPAGYIIPAHLAEESSMAWRPVGTGPFFMKEWKRDEIIVLERFDNYFDKPPAIERIIFRIIPDEFTTLTEYERGNIDIMAVPEAEFDRYTKAEPYKSLVHSIADLNIYYLGINCKDPKFSDPRVRQALNMAVDRAKILEKVEMGRGILAKGSIPPGLPGFDDARAPYPHNPARARALLAEAGYPDGIKCNIYHRPTQRAAQIVAAIQASMAEANIFASIIKLEWTALKQAIIDGETDVFFMAWVADYPDGENFLAPVFHSSNHGSAGNRAFFSDKDVDNLIELAQREIWEESRNNLYKRIDERVFSLAPWVYLWHGVTYTVQQPWVLGYEPSVIYNSDKGLNYRIKRE